MRSIRHIIIAMTVFAALYAVINNTFYYNFRRDHIPHVKHKKEKKGYPEKYAQYFHGISTPVGSNVSGYSVGYNSRELRKAREGARQLKSTQQFPWVERGPGNVSGRTRALIVDPDDPDYQTWYAGSASGGIWKTDDGGRSWEVLTEDFPTLAISALVMAPSDHNIIYAGSGEGFTGYPAVVGNGIFKSVDRGMSWEQLSSTTGNENFRYVNMMIVDPQDEDIVIACTNKGIFKSIDGGSTWDTTYSTGYQVQDIDSDPYDFSVLYAAVNSLGIIKSTDAGDTWDNAYEGMGTGYRYTVAVSPVNPDRLFSQVEAPNYVTDVYISSDGAETWNKLKDPDGSFMHFLQTQGGYDNVVRAHPFNENVAFLGGVYFGKVEFLTKGINIYKSEPQVLRVDTSGTGEFLSFVNFGGSYLGGGMSTGDVEDAEDLILSDWVSVEIRFGEGKTQKAHRFIVPEGEGAGVPPEDYTYMDYIDVPFEVWDIDNNRQLMVSFRDQERDGEFNLFERDYDDEISGREYIFVSAHGYDSLQPDTNMAKDGGYVNKLLYFFWPTLMQDKEWNADSLPESDIHVTYGNFTFQEATTTVLSDDKKNTELHVDHHEIIMIPTDIAKEEFTILNGNDGGLAISYNGGDTWKQIRNGYITTQFYGIAKKPGAHEYIGGMQDNGTWQSPSGETASVTSSYLDRLGGDGFETLWHPWYPHRIIASIYNNRFRLSNDGGETWLQADRGINEDGPFFSRLSHHVKNPNLIFAVGSRGVYKHSNFGFGRYEWELVELDEGWYSNRLRMNDFFNVRVSLADSSVVWAGAGMHDDPELNIFVSEDAGESFNPTLNYSGEEVGYITGIATHPFNRNTAYLLFSLKERPKILRTTDMGNSWEDITGFTDSDSSVNGFPDVMVFSLLVMPYDTNTIWAGTEIGIFESTDNGETWHFANNGLPAVSVWQLAVMDNQLIVATHGRGIWTADLNLVSTREKSSDNKSMNIFPNPASEYFRIEFTDDNYGKLNIQLISIDGSIIHRENIMKNNRQFEHRVNISGIKPGNYVLQVKSGEELYSEKLILQ